MKTIKQYINDIDKELATGKATEHSYRHALKKLIESLGKDLEATNEPKREECGAPDFIVSKNKIPLGYIEAKDIDKDLNKEEKSEQMARYLDGLGNIILTNYLEFRWYEKGILRLSAQIAKESRGKILKLNDNFSQFEQLLNEFLKSKIPIIGNAKELAKRMADNAKIIKDVIINAYDKEDDNGSFHSKLNAFRKVLLHDLESDQFADMYAQTICYGLFSAKCSHTGKEPFTREKAAFELPETNPFLREMFNHIAGVGLEKELKWAVEHLAELLNRADIEGVIRDFGKRTRHEDPVVHFYETFLAEYDPKMREARGVYYTPEPVVSYIVRSIDHILKNDFKIKDGLADTTKIPIFKETKDKNGKIKREKIGETHKVLILDPAVGTGTFLHGVIDHIHENIVSQGQAGAWSGYVSEHLLPRLFGFELLMAPYAVAHMKLGLQLAETGYDFKSGERLRIYLTNTLEEAHKIEGLDLFASKIAEEANSASEIKSEAPVMVVLGNPPYSYKSENKGTWISQLIKNYYYYDGKPLGEKNPKGLQDDYVKFIRFAQWRIEQTGYGIVGIISNHSFLNNPTFRGMRQSLLQTFDKIYLLDLHGNVKKKEKCTDGTKDENVFDIQQGVSISLLVKEPMTKKDATLNHSNIYGTRSEKYKWLTNYNIETTKWLEINPIKPFHLFTPQETSLLSEYDAYTKITDIFMNYSTGLYTARDKFAINWSLEETWKKINELVNSDIEKVRQEYNVGSDSKDWTIEKAKNDIKLTGLDKMKIQRILYRPFDTRFAYYTGKSNGIICRPRHKTMANMLNLENIGLIAVRQVAEESFTHIFISKFIVECRITLSNKGYGYLFPLFVNSNINNGLFANKTFHISSRFHNINNNFIQQFSEKIDLEFVLHKQGSKKNTFDTNDLLNYIYSVLNSQSYRSRYLGFLKMDFPRVPIISNKKLFFELINLGEKLVSLHLMDKHADIKTKYPIDGDHIVEKVRYTEPGQGSPKGRVWINKTQYFEGVPPEVWEFQIGGYQVCHKWLKDRKGRLLSYDDQMHYQHIVSALFETINIMTQIDQVIEKHGGWPIR